MPLVIKKAKPAEVAPAAGKKHNFLLKAKPTLVSVEPSAPETSAFAELIDKVGTLQKEAEPITAQIKQLQEKLKPLKAAESELQQKVDAVEAEDDVKGIELGESFQVDYGAKGKNRTVKDMERIVDIMGSEVFLQVCKIDLKEVDKYLTEAQKEEVLEITRGSRSFKVLARA